MEDWVIALISTVGSIAVSTVIGTIIKNSITKKVSEHDELIKLRAEKEHEEYKKEISNVLREELDPLQQKVDAMAEVVDLTKLGNVTVLRQLMIQAHDMAVKQGYISRADLFSWQEMYKTYTILGGNNFAQYIDRLKDEIEALPEEKPKKGSKNK